VIKMGEKEKFRKIQLYRYGRVREVTTYPTLEDKWSCKFVDDPEFPEDASIILTNVTFSKKDFPDKKDIPQVIILKYVIEGAKL